NNGQGGDAAALSGWLLLADGDLSVQGIEGGVHAAAVDRAGEVAVQSDPELAVGRIVFLSDAAAAEAHVKIAPDLSAVGIQLEVRLQIGGKRHVDRPVQSAEGERLGGIHAIHGDADRTI